jgi:HSP20 family protein
MNQTRWEPKDIAREINSMRNDMEKLIDSFFGPNNLFRREGKTLSNWSPSVEIIESEKDYTIRADLPGMEAKDIEVEATSNSISIKGEYKNEKEEKTEHHYYSERSYGSFYRAIPLDEDIKLDSLTSSMKNGVLEIKAIKVTESKPKVQKVKVEISS